MLQLHLDFFQIFPACVKVFIFFMDIETAQGQQGAGSEADGGGWPGSRSGLKEEEGQGRRTLVTCGVLKDAHKTLSTVSFIMSFLNYCPQEVTMSVTMQIQPFPLYSRLLCSIIIDHNLMPLRFHHSVFNGLMCIQMPKHFSCVRSCIFRRKHFKNATLVLLSKVSFHFMTVLFPHFHSNRKNQTFIRSTDATTIFSLTSHREMPWGECWMVTDHSWAQSFTD